MKIYCNLLAIFLVIHSTNFCMDEYVRDTFIWDHNRLPFNNNHADHKGEKCLSERALLLMTSDQREWTLARWCLIANEALHGNVRQGNGTVVSQLIHDYHIPVDSLNKFGETPLQIAARARHFAIIDLLMQAGADVFRADERSLTIFQKLSQDVQEYLLKQYPILRNRFK